MRQAKSLAAHRCCGYLPHIHGARRPRGAPPYLPRADVLPLASAIEGSPARKWGCAPRSGDARGPPSPRSTESCAVYSAGMPWAFGPTFSHHLHKTILNLLYQMHNHFQIAVLGLLSLKSLVSLVALPGVVGLVALEGLLGCSSPFYPF